jgi:formylglycine-generating enzyme required for sulfatase activity
MAEGHDIFLSYASQDLERVRPLIRSLEKRGWRVWWDRTLLPGEDYEEVIDQAIAAAGCVIVVWSHASVDSGWVRAEADEGRSQRKLVPVMIDDVRIPLSFRATHTAPLMDWEEGVPHQEFERVVQAVTNLVPPSPPPEPEATPPPPSLSDEVERPEPFGVGEEQPRGSKAGLVWGVSLGVVALALVVWLVVVNLPKSGTYALTIRATPADSTITLVHSAVAYAPGVALPPGRYTIEVSRAGYVTTRRTVRIGKADVLLEIALVPASKQYALTVRAQPADSTVRLINTDVAYRPGVKLTPGRYTVEITGEGYETTRREVVIADADVTLDVTLKPVKTTYKLTVRAFPEDSTIKILNIVPKYHPGIELEPGDYRLLVEREGFRGKRRTVTIREADVVEEIELEPVTYQLTVQATPSDSIVTLLHPEIVYRPGVELAPGEYGVRVQREGYVKVERSVRIVDHNVTLPVRLEPVKEPEPRLPPVFRNRIGMGFVLIPDGEFQMGSTDGYDNERPVHLVRISKPFYLGKYEVTQRQWQAVMGENPSHFMGNLDLPVEQVSWEVAQKFVAKLNERESGERYRLPTEAEWEYAARAGSTTAYSYGNDSGRLGEYAWYDGNADGKTHPVGERKPNKWGLHGMHGNVWEWVQDWYGEYAAEAVTDPAGPAAGSSRVVRGGSWLNSARYCRSALRTLWHPGARHGYLGLRLVRTSA